MRIAILTGGGDVPGLNPCIKAITMGAAREGWDVIGFRRGWAGPLHYNPENAEECRAHLLRLTPDFVRTIARTGGTILHSSRTNPAKVKPADLPEFLGNGSGLPRNGGTFDTTSHVLRVLESLKIDALVAIGGDDTLSYAARLHQEGFAVMAAPKTMDNDVFGTDYCMGFSTAVSRSLECVTALRTPTGSHERIGVIELFGRNSGETALITGYLADHVNRRKLLMVTQAAMGLLAQVLDAVDAHQGIVRHDCLYARTMVLARMPSPSISHSSRSPGLIHLLISKPAL